MGNEHFWQVPRAKGVYARSITKHARREKQGGTSQRTTRRDTRGRPSGAGISGPTAGSPKSAI